MHSMNLFFSLGAVHDGTSGAENCSFSNNNIMTAAAGNFDTMILTFSTCSINAFKKTLTSNKYLKSKFIHQLLIIKILKF